METKTYEQRIEEMSGYLARQAAIFPQRDESHERFLAASIELADFLIAGLDFEAFRPDAAALARCEAIADNPIFLCGQMKSGTTLLFNLLDGHPELMATPVSTHYLPTEGRWNRDDFRSIAGYWMQRVISPTGKEPFWFVGKERSRLESMLLHLRYFIRNTPHDVFVCAALALMCCQGRGEHVRHWVEKTTQNELKAEELLRRFPKARFVHVARDPLANLASLKRLAGVRSNKFRARKRAQSVRKLFQAGKHNQETLGSSKYHIVRYEDLTRDTEAVMRGVAEFLGLRFEPSLLEPTENGLPATSNSMYSEARVRGRVLDQSQNTRFVEDLTAREIMEIVEVLRETAAQFGYDWSHVPLKRRGIWPFGRG